MTLLSACLHCTYGVSSNVIYYYSDTSTLVWYAYTYCERCFASFETWLLAMVGSLIGRGKIVWDILQC